MGGIGPGSGGTVPDVAIVGGGVVGVACAGELARRGASVVVLERDRVGHGCSYGNAGLLTPSLSIPLAAPGNVGKALRWLLDPEGPFYIQPRLDPALASWLLRFLFASRRSKFEPAAAALVELSRWTVDAFEQLAAGAPEPFAFARRGLLGIYETEKGFAAGRAAAEHVGGLGIRWEEWSAEEVRQRQPAVRGEQIGGLFFPDDAQCEPYPAVLALTAEARRAGVEIAEGVEVTGAERAADGTVRALSTSSGPVAAREFVLAAGPLSGKLARRFGFRLPMLGAKGYTLVLPALDPQPTCVLYLGERKIAINPQADSLRLSGTLELVDDDLSVNRRRVDAIVRLTDDLVPLPRELATGEPWRGLRPCTPDGMPVIGRSPAAANLWLATGHQMTGLKTSLGTARLLAELMAGEPPTFDPEPFRAGRF